MAIPEKIPALTAYQQALNAYNPDVYAAHKKITAEEWNALLLSGFAQGNRQEYYLDQIVNGHLTELIETVNEAIDALEDHELRLIVIEALKHNYYDKEEVDGLLDGKVDKEAGKGLSTNDLTNTLKTAYDEAVNKKHEHSNKAILDSTNAAFTTTLKTGYDDANTKKHTHSNKTTLDATTASYTTDEKSKLATLENSHFRGQYLSKTALDSAVPSGNVGDYAYVDSGAGFLVQKYLWDSSDNVWVPAASEGGEETPASIKQKYESNPDTNAYTNAEKTKVANALVTTGDIKDTVTTFTEAGTRENIATGEKTSTIFGKIKKWFTDLKPHAFANPSTIAPLSSAAASNDKVYSEKLTYTEFQNRTHSRVITSVTALGLTYPTTTVAILNALVTGLYYDTVVDIGLSAPGSANITDLPDNYGHLHIYTPATSSGILRWSITYHNEQGNGQSKMYIGKILRSLVPGQTNTVIGITYSLVPDVMSNNTFVGINTFTGTVTVPTPNGSDAAVPKSYVDSIGEATTIGVEATDLNTLIEDGGKWRATSTALAANCSNKPESSPTGFVLECVEMRRSDTPYRTKMQTYRSNNGTWYRIGSQATSADAVTWNAWANLIVSTGAQTIGGAKTFTNNVTVTSPVPEIILKSTTDVYNVTAPFLPTGLKCTDKNGVYTGAFRTFRSGDGSTSANMTARNQSNATMTVGLRGFTDGTWALLGDSGVVDIGSSSFPFKDLYLAGNINAAGTITGNVVNSPYKLIASGTLAAGTSLTLNSLMLTENQAGRPFYMRIWGGTTAGSDAGGHFKYGDGVGVDYTGTIYVQDLLSETYSLLPSSGPTNAFLGGITTYIPSVIVGNFNRTTDLIKIYYHRWGNGTNYKRQITATQNDGGTVVRTQAIAPPAAPADSNLYFVNDDDTKALNYQLYSANY